LGKIRRLRSLTTERAAGDISGKQFNQAHFHVCPAGVTPITTPTTPQSLLTPPAAYFNK
jgi:hypothetical protein